MEIIKKQEKGRLDVQIVGELNTSTAPEMKREVAEKLDGVKELVLDLAGVDYLSSAGLRVILRCQKTMDEQGTMIVKNVNPEIDAIFKATGFVEILTIIP